ncbi:hypothetical protein NM208_g9654 [Fusarium decemcellulare]|uniref:Uncharacterized protein n=1 Tax=Fusarium decemcellulare TaxID=57161 RepID=A0ACC1S0X5_9HYPO|nr:hypothetical protein NM208_g9654 [Fusarium decemcellulare]
MGDNRGTRLLASCWSMTAAAAVLLFLRIYCKLWRGRGLWWDDHLLIASWVALSIAVSINTYLVSLGFGRHMDTIDDDDLKTINLNTILVATFGIIATTTSKSSFAITLPLQRVWDPSVPGTCWNKKRLLHYQLFAAYYSAILDFILAFLPWPILMRMSMLRRERLGVAVAMSLGAIAGITGIVKAVLVVNMTSTDITYDRVDLTIWTLTEPAASIMAVCIPVLRMLYRELKSSQRSYMRNRSTTNPHGTGPGTTNPGTDTRRNTKRYAPNSKYGRNSVVIMSTAGWQESQEALKDTEGSVASKTSQNLGGVLKTEQVTVKHERLSTFSDENSIEMKSLGPAQRNDDNRRVRRDTIAVGHGKAVSTPGRSLGKTFVILALSSLRAFWDPSAFNTHRPSLNSAWSAQLSGLPVVHPLVFRSYLVPGAVRALRSVFGYTSVGGDVKDEAIRTSRIIQTNTFVAISNIFLLAFGLLGADAMPAIPEEPILARGYAALDDALVTRLVVDVAIVAREVLGSNTSSILVRTAGRALWLHDKTLH